MQKWTTKAMTAIAMILTEASYLLCAILCVLVFPRFFHSYPSSCLRLEILHGFYLRNILVFCVVTLFLRASDEDRGKWFAVAVHSLFMIHDFLTFFSSSWIFEIHKRKQLANTLNYLHQKNSDENENLWKWEKHRNDAKNERQWAIRPFHVEFQRFTEKSISKMNFLCSLFWQFFILGCFIL